MSADTIAASPAAARYGRLFGHLSFILLPLYRLYERRLLTMVRAHTLPRHVGIILDGNRRYALKRGVTDPRDIYDLGARKLDDVLDWCAEIDIPAVTLWVFSPDNFRRPSDEVSGILAAIETKLLALAQDARVHDRRVRVRALGKLSPGPRLGSGGGPDGGKRDRCLRRHGVEHSGGLRRAAGDYRRGSGLIGRPVQGRGDT